MFFRRMDRVQNGFAAVEARRHALISMLMAAAVGMPLALPTPAAAAQDYTVTSIPSLGGAEVYGWGINELGQVAGWSYTSGISSPRALLYSNGISHNLGVLGGDASTGEAINNNGWVVGISSTSGAASHAFKWVNGVMTDLGTLGSANWNSGALGINDHNEIVGYSENGAMDSNGYAIRHAVKWDSNGFIHDLGVYSGDTHSYAYDINNYGDAVGYSDDGPGGAFIRHPVKFVNGGGVVFLGSLGGTFGHAWSINNAGAICGDSYLAGNSNSHAFKWSDGIMHDLGSWGAGIYSDANDINDWGQLVGIAPKPHGFWTHASRWVGAHDTLQDINNYMPNGYDVVENSDSVNGLGQVLGRSIHGDAYLLTPPNLQIVLYGPDPGYAGANNTYTVYGCTPGGSVRIYYGLRNGSTAVPGCPGVTVDINSAVLGVTTTANGSGRASVVAHSPNAARNRVVRLQAVDMSTCRVSQLVQFRYR